MCYSPIAGGNDSRKRQEKRLILKIGIIHSTINERFSFIWSIHSFCSCLACSGQKRRYLTFSLHSLFSSTSHLFAPRRPPLYLSTLKITNYLPIFTSYYVCIIMHMLLFISPDWLAYFRSHDYLSFKSTQFFIYFQFVVSDEGRTLEMLDYTIRVGSTRIFLYFNLYLLAAYAVHSTFISFGNMFLKFL